MAAFGKNETWNFPEDEKLFNLGFWAGFIGWMILVFSAVQGYFSLVQSIPTLIHMSLAEQISLGVAALSPILKGIFFWFLLQALKAVLYAMIDIKDLLIENEPESEA